jgi:hypothetical protein
VWGGGARVWGGVESAHVWGGGCPGVWVWWGDVTFGEHSSETIPLSIRWCIQYGKCHYGKRRGACFYGSHTHTLIYSGTMPLVCSALLEGPNRPKAWCLTKFIKDGPEQ